MLQRELSLDFGTLQSVLVFECEFSWILALYRGFQCFNDLSLDFRTSQSILVFQCEPSLDFGT